MKTHEQLVAEIRYAIRLCQRTARLYRRVQTLGTFVSIIGGSAIMAGLYAAMPTSVTLAGMALMAASGAALIAIRPADKAAQNEADIKRYQTLMAKASALNAEQLQGAIDEAHQGDAPEIEGLRNVAYNDVMREINREDQSIPLSSNERLLKALA